jgi:DNA-binding beta-propeller fold protein YncE
MRRMIRSLVVAALSGAIALGAAAGSGAQVEETLYGGLGGAAISDLLVLDPATGELLDSVGSTGFGVTGLAIRPDGVLYGVTSAPGSGERFLVQIDRATGAATPIGGPLGLNVADITFIGDTLYGWSESGDDLATIDLTTGVATIVGSSGLGTFGSGLAYDSASDRLLFAGEGSSGDLYVIDPDTGGATVLSTLNDPEDDAVSALAFGCDGTLYGVLLVPQTGTGGGPARLATIDPDSGNVTVVGDTQDGLDAIVFDCIAPPPAPPGPEPIVLEPTFTG